VSRTWGVDLSVRGFPSRSAYIRAIVRNRDDGGLEERVEELEGEVAEMQAAIEELREG